MRARFRSPFVGKLVLIELRYSLRLNYNYPGTVYKFIIKMSKAHPPELKKFMDKKISLKLNGGRQVNGILRGFDPFMNLVIDETVEVSKNGFQYNLGMVVIRGNSVVMLEALDRV